MIKNRFFKKLASGLALAAIALAAIQPVRALAADGTYEAEDAVISGTPSYGDTFVESKDSASGGKSIGYFGTVGNKITWTVNEGAGDVTLTFVLASGAMDWTTWSNCDMNLAGQVKITVNGTEVAYDDITLAGNANYDNWTDVNVQATLAEGDNEVALEYIGTMAPNIDCLKIGPAGQGNSGSGSTASFEAFTLEAEDAEISGTPSYGDTFYEDKESASGGKSLGYLGTTGNKVTWTVNGASGNVTLTFRMASSGIDWTTWSGADQTIADIIKITVNGTDVTFDDQTLPAGEGFNCDNWQDVNVNATLKDGDNTVTVEVVGSACPNIDYLKVAPASQSSGTKTVIVEKEVVVEKEVTVNKYVTVPTRIEKTSSQNLKDIACFGGIILAVLLVIYVIVAIIRKATMSAADKEAYNKIKAERKALKADFKANYKNVSGAEEKEIARYDYKLKKSELKAKAYKEIEGLTYGEGASRVKALDRAYKKHLPACLCGILVIACVLGSIIGMNYTGNVTIENPAPLKVASSLIVTGYDWGPGANKLVISLPGNVKAGDVSADMFAVSVTKQGLMEALGDTVEDRTVVDAYISDEEGNKVSGKSKYITIEMAVSPSDDATDPFHYDFMDTQRNTWADPYTHTVTLVAGKKLQIGNTLYSSIDCTKQAKVICPELDEVTEHVVTYDDIELRYAEYAPEKLTKDNTKNALIIWLHGAGEGGEDIRINTLGNRVVALWSDEVQQYFDGNGAYVIAPQTPTMWMNSGDGEYTSDGTSMYTEALWQLIDNYVKSNPDVDTDRIIIGGCSNGGYMTMNMIMLHPDYFAAAYPCCEAYADAWITDEQINSIKDLPIWFTQAKNDPTVDPYTYNVLTYDRLIKAGAANVHFTFWDDVRDLSGLYTNEDGTAYSYNGHYSWIYALNNDCTLEYDGTTKVQLNGKDTTLWQWLAAQHK